MKIKSYITLLLLFVGFETAYPQEAKVIDKVVAVVGKNVILQSDIDAQYMQYRLQGGIKGTAKSIRCEILEDLLFQKLMLNQAEMDSITITDEQVNSEVESRLRYFINQLGSQEKLENYYNKTMAEIREELTTIIRDQFLVQQVQQTIVSNVFVTPAEVKEFYRSIPADSIPMINAEYEIAQLVKNRLSLLMRNLLSKTVCISCVNVFSTVRDFLLWLCCIPKIPALPKKEEN